MRMTLKNIEDMIKKAHHLKGIQQVENTENVPRKEDFDTMITQLQMQF